MYSCTNWLRPRNSPPLPPNLCSFTKALLVSFFVTPWPLWKGGSAAISEYQCSRIAQMAAMDQNADILTEFSGQKAVSVDVSRLSQQNLCIWIFYTNGQKLKTISVHTIQKVQFKILQLKKNPARETIPLTENYNFAPYTVFHTFVSPPVAPCTVLVIPTETVTIYHIVRYNNHHLPIWSLRI